MTDAPSPHTRWVRLAVFAIVTIVGLALLWPVPTGAAPLSKDHTVHLTRAWMWAQFLAEGSPRGYSEVWFFGTPIGELYPILGDALVVALRVLGLGLLDWHQAYALAFTVVFVSQGWVMIRLANVCGFGPIGGPVAGLVGGVAILVDAGAYREGGWIYTVDYGVWPQALANSMTFLALAEILAALEADGRARVRAVVRAGLAAAGAMLAHQISLPVLVLTGAIVLAIVGLRRRARFGEVAVVVGAALGLGFALAAWWVLPMMAMRGWMVSYGWLWQPLQWMIDEAWRGHLTQGMPAGVSAMIVLGLGLVAVRGSDGARAIVASGLALWVWTSADTLWRLRLDLFDPAFGQMQWQRFLIASKPALFLAGAAAVALPCAWAWTWWQRGRARALAAVPVAAAIALIAWAGVGQAAVMEKAAVGRPQIAVDPEDAELAADYDAMAEHLRSLWEADADQNWRMTVAAARNQHWYMDLPVRTGIPLYKQGFTPGDNFVHKPEAETPALLDRLGVRYVLTRKRASVRNAAVVATFGQLRLWERRSWQPVAAARIDGAGTLSVVQDDPSGDGVVVEVQGAAEGDRLVFDAAGYPRWTLTRDGAPVEWFEVPAVGDGPDATIAERKSGAWLGGKADGDDGTEPTLIAVDAADGQWRLHYDRWRGRDVFAALLSVLAAAFAIVSVQQCRRSSGTPWLLTAQAVVAPRVRPWMLGALVAAGGLLFVIRTGAARAKEELRAVGWLEHGDATATLAKAGPLKTDMAIHPAILVQRRRIPGKDDAPPKHPDASVRFAGVSLPDRLTGWFALDDDAAKLRGDGKHHVRVDALGPAGTTTLFDADVRHQPGRVFLDVPTDALVGTRVELVVTIESEGRSPPPMGFDLDLGPATGSGTP